MYKLKSSFPLFSATIVLTCMAALGLGCNGADLEPVFDAPLVERGFNLEDNETPQLTAENVLSAAEESGYVEIPLESISDAELQQLIAAADELVEFDSELESERFIAYAKGDLALMNSAPIGLDSGDFDWSELAKIEEHGRVFAYLSERGLIGEIEAELPPGTWLTAKHAAEVLPKSELEGLAKFEFESFAGVEQALGDEGPSPLESCGVTTCSSWCGGCRTTVHFAWNHIIVLRQRTCHSHCSNNCGCTGSAQWTQGC